ncbi:MAG TPA: hypothetical protein PKM27_19675, partial [Saprospiraceae bacterium]|nr:hypothetical protein [Saprospiraceae bacterium]
PFLRKGFFDPAGTLPHSLFHVAHVREQCVRFLTDHLQGDLYYHQPFTGFNLKAVQVQQEFIRMLRRKRAWMEERWAGLVAGLVP